MILIHICVTLYYIFFGKSKGKSSFKKSLKKQVDSFFGKIDVFIPIDTIDEDDKKALLSLQTRFNFRSSSSSFPLEPSSPCARVSNC